VTRVVRASADIRDADFLAASRSPESWMKDELTELANPEAFRLLVEHELAVARRQARTHTLLVIDVSGL
jgi:GGDEF domain-containing protein